MMKNLRQINVSFLKQLICRKTLNEKGLVTAEAAIATFSLVTILSFCLSVIYLVFNQIIVFEAARDASRMLSRGESEVIVEQKINQLVKDSTIEINYDNNLVTVWVAKEIFGLFKTSVSANSTSYYE